MQTLFSAPRQLLQILCLAALTPLCAAAPDVRITSIDPQAGQYLATGEALYLRISYQSEQSLRFRVRGTGRNSEAGGLMTSTSPLYQAGKGEALAWLAYRDSMQLRDIRLEILDARWQPLASIDQPVNIHWTGQSAKQARAEAPWVRELRTRQQQITGEQLREAHGSGSGGSLLMLLMGWSIPFYFVLQWWTWKHWQNGWRRAGLLPLWLAVPTTGWSLIALLTGSNLWPLAMLFVMPLLLAFLLVVWASRYIAGQRSAR